MSTDIPAASELETIGEIIASPPLPAEAAPKMRGVFYLVSALVGGNVAGKLLGMVSGALLLRYVSPKVYGLFSSIGLVLSYAPFLQLGVLNGLNRELPYYIGKGDRKRVLELAAAAQAWALVVGGAVALCLFGVAAWQLAIGDLWMAACWATYALLALSLFYNNYYLQMTYRTSHDFARLAMAGVVENIVGLVTVALVVALDFYGLCLRALLISGVGFAFLYYWRPVRVHPIWNTQHFKHLLVIGLPIFGVGQLYSWWIALDSTFVLSFAGVEAMGLYSGLVIKATGTLDLLPAALCQVIYPRMAEHYGRLGSVGELIRMSVKPMMIAAVGMAAMVAVGWWLIEPVVLFIAPKYVGAVPAAQWGLLIPVLSSFTAVLNVYNVVRRQDLYAVAIILGMLAYFGALAWLMHGGVSLVAFPQAMLIGRAVFVGMGYVLLIPISRKKSATR